MEVKNQELSKEWREGIEREVGSLKKRATPKKEVIPVEHHLLEIPRAIYSKRKQTKTYVTYEGTVTRQGITVPIKTEFGSMYGCLSSFDDEVFIGAICNFTVQLDKGLYISNFSCYEVLKLLHKPRNKQVYERLREALKKIGALYLSHTGFYAAKDGEHQPITGYPVFKFHLLRDKDDKQRDNWFIWNEYFANNFLKKYFKHLSLKTYLSLPTPISRAIYGYLDMRFGKDSEYREGVKKLMDRIPITEKNITHKKETLLENCKILKEHGVISKYLLKGNQIFFSREPRKTKEDYRQEGEEYRANRFLEKEEHKRRNEVFVRLLEIGVKDEMILSLFKRRSLEIIERQIQYLPYRRTTKNRPGLIVKAIIDNWDMPKIYEEAKEERLRQGKRDSDV